MYLKLLFSYHQPQPILLGNPRALRANDPLRNDRKELWEHRFRVEVYDSKGSYPPIQHPIAFY